MNNIIQLAGRSPMPPGHKVARYLGEENRALISPEVAYLRSAGERVGHQKGCLRGHLRAASADISHTVQGNQLSHSFTQIARDIFAVVFWLGFIGLCGLSISGAIFFLLFFATF